MTRSTDWDQEAFDKADRRGPKRELAARAEKQHDLLCLQFAPSSREAVHAIVHAGTRHADSVHAHDDAMAVSCPLNDAAGLRTKLEGLFRANEVAVELSHGTFSAGSDIAQNISSLR